MSEAEQLLREAQDIARRAFDEPAQETVMRLFDRLCLEADDRRLACQDEPRETVH